MAHVFISYATEDRVRAEAVHNALEAGGVDCWMAPDDIPAGGDWPAAIFQAIQDSGAMILIFSKSANDSGDVNQELLIARDQKIPIIPFFLEDIRPSGASGYHLSNLQHIYGYRMPPVDAHRALRRALETRGLVAAEARPAPRRLDPPAVGAPLSANVLFTERDWDLLIYALHKGSVVPIIGPELLQVTVDGRPVQLYTHLAEQLANALNLPWDESANAATLATVVSRFFRQERDKREAFVALNRLFPKPDQLGIPESLRKLASIPTIRLFVTTTFDSSMERALQEVRPDAPVRVLAHTPHFRNEDIPEVQQSIGESIVYHLFGRLAPTPTYALTDEDMQETLYALDSERLDRLSTELATRHILLLGTNLPDWLARSLVRLIRSRSAIRQPPTVIADSRLHSDASFRAYLEQASQGLSVYSGSAVSFVDELVRRWNHSRPVEPSLGMPSGAIYLSFASADLEAARKLAASLDAAGLQAWLGSVSEDESDVIRRNIQRSAAFLPIISRHAVGMEHGVFRREWHQAIEVSLGMRLDTPFIIPVVIDDQSPDTEAVPHRFRELKWASSDPANLDADLVKILRQLVRRYRLTTVNAGE